MPEQYNKGIDNCKDNMKQSSVDSSSVQLSDKATVHARSARKKSLLNLTNAATENVHCSQEKEQMLWRKKSKHPVMDKSLEAIFTQETVRVAS